MIAESVYPLLAHQIRENGGPYEVTRDCEAVVAIPSYSTAGEKAQQGLARPVYVVRDFELRENGGPFRVIQNQGSRVVKFVPGAVAAGGQDQFGVAEIGQAQAIYVKSGTPDYYLKLLNLFGRSIIGYWPGSEPSLATAYDYSGNRFNGNYVGVTLGQPGAGDGLTCPLHDGVGDFNNIYSSGLATAFSAGEMTLAIWAKMFNAGIWTDATRRDAFYMDANGNNQVRLERTATNNQFDFTYVAGATSKQVLNTSLGGVTSFFHVAITVSKLADQMKAYINGVQVGSTQTGLGVWVGALVAGDCNIGCQTTAGVRPWNGWLAHGILLNRAATLAEMAVAAVI